MRLLKSMISQKLSKFISKPAGGGEVKNSKLKVFLTFILLFQLIAGIFLFGISAGQVKADTSLSDDFSAYADYSSATSNWTASSGTWIVENGQYKHQTVGKNYIKSRQTLFSDNFTESDGPAAGWTTKAGTWAVPAIFTRGPILPVCRE